MKFTELQACCRTKNCRGPKKYDRVEYPHNGFNTIPKGFIRLDPCEAEYLYMMAKKSQLGIVELGRFKGGSTLLMAAAANVHVHSVDIDPVDDVYLSQLIDELDIDNIELYVDDSQKTDLPHTIEYDLLFVDGDHSYEGAFNDMDNWWDNLAIGGHVILHDCYDMYDIPQAVSDFIVGKNIAMHVSPFNSYNVWENKWGSICHFQKLGA